MTDQDLPSPREELERKTVDVLTFLVERAQNKRLKQRDLALAGSVLWSVTGGLVGQDVSQLCAATADQGKAEPMKRHFVGKGTVRTVAWFPDRAGYAVISRDCEGEVLNKTARPADVGEREGELELLFNALRRAGYQEI